MLSCAKIKGKPFKPTLLNLDLNRRWFDISSETPSAKPSAPNAQEIANFIAAQTEARTAEILEHFKQRGAQRTIEERIADAERLGLISKVNQKSPWRAGNGKNHNSSDIGKAATESTEHGFPHFRIPYSRCGNAEMHDSDGTRLVAVLSHNDTISSGPAIWRNADHDQPVTVRVDAGQGQDGRRYVWIEESVTAIPADELFINPLSEKSENDPMEDDDGITISFDD